MKSILNFKAPLKQSQISSAGMAAAPAALLTFHDYWSY